MHNFHIGDRVKILIPGTYCGTNEGVVIDCDNTAYLLVAWRVPKGPALVESRYAHFAELEAHE